MTIRIQNNQWSLEHCSILCIIPFAALCPRGAAGPDPVCDTPQPPPPPPNPGF